MQLLGSVLFGADELVAEFVRVRIKHLRSPEHTFGKCAALGVVSGPDQVLIGGVVFTNYRGFDIEMSGAFDKPWWCRHDTLRTLFSYPFGQLNCIRMTTVTGKKNKAARRIDEHMGFKLEGVARRGLDGVEDACIYSMLRHECRWIRK